MNVPQLSAATERIWYSLVDQEGKPFAGASVDFVFLPAGAIVGDLRDSVKVKNSDILKGVVSAQLVVYLNESGLKEKKQLEPDDEVGKLGKTKKDALLVVVPESKSLTSTTKQKTYKGMSIEASCRKYLDALAVEIAKLYDFETKFRNPSMGDVFDALSTNTWSYRRKKNKVLTNVPLPSMFSAAEWDELKDMNVETNNRIHDGHLPETSNSKKFVIIPHEKYTASRAEMLKRIAATANIVFYKEELVVKDAAEVSGSSGSESGSPK